MIIGLNCAGSSECLLTTPILISQINKVEIINGCYDYLFGSNNYKTNEAIWDFDTAFYAHFNNNLIAGNIDYLVDSVSSIKIKRRQALEHKWFTICEIPIGKKDDFLFEVFDKFCRSNQDYDYAFVPVINHVEGNMSINSIRSQFRHYFIVDRDTCYPIIFNTDLKLQLNQQTSIINTLGSKYPFIISNSNSQYKTGSLSFGLAHMVNCEIDVDNGREYREQFEQWIMNGKPKIIKDWTGYVYMVQITDNIPIDNSCWQLPTYEIQFVEIGNPLDETDMYNNGLIDTISTLSTSYLL